MAERRPFLGMIRTNWILTLILWGTLASLAALKFAVDWGWISAQ